METNTTQEFTDGLITVADQLAPLGQAQKELMDTTQVLQLASQINLNDQVAIAELGSGPANALSGFSGRILNNLTVAETMGSTKMMDELGKIMKQFDITEIKEEPKKGLAKIFHKAKMDLGKLLAKYQTLGGQIDVVYQELVKYEDQVKRNIKMLNELADENVKFSIDLDQYIATGYVLQNKIKNELLPNLQERINNGDQMATIEVSRMNATLEAVERRTYDLEQSKTMALMTGPQIDMNQKNNTLLLAQIHSAFITTIPAFKTSMIQAVVMKQQKNTNDALNTLRERNNEMIIRNAQNLATNSVNISRSASAPSVSIETLESAWQAIQDGIKETRVVEAESKAQRASSRERLESLGKNIQETQIN